MGNRKLPFGYQMEMGKIVVQVQEAEVVQHIFRQYIAGATYQSLVMELKEQPIPYNAEKLWNKNMVARILEDRRYQGEKDYPAIVKPEEMDTVARKRRAKQCPVQKTETQKILRQLSGHTATKRLEQQVLSALNSLIGRPEKIHRRPSTQVSTEVIKLRKELDDVLERQPIDEDAARKLTLAIAAAQYDAIESEEYETERLCRRFAKADPMESLDADLLRSTVSAIQICGNGEIRIRLKNNQIIGRGNTP